MAQEDHAGDSGWITTFVFIAGLLFGAGTALLFTPESGPALRNRLARGAKVAQDELTDLASETKETLTTVSKEAQEAIEHMAARVTAAVDAVKEAIVAQPPESGSEEEVRNDRPAPLG